MSLDIKQAIKYQTAEGVDWNRRRRKKHRSTERKDGREWRERDIDEDQIDGERERGILHK